MRRRWCRAARVRGDGSCSTVIAKGDEFNLLGVVSVPIEQAGTYSFSKKKFAYKFNSYVIGTERETILIQR